MPQKCKVALLLTPVLFLVSATYGQSLGDVARQQRQKLKDNPTPHKVITNDDIPESPEAAADSSAKDDHDITQKSSEETKTGDQWKAEIEAQRNAIESLQNQIDKVSRSIRFVEASRYGSAAEWNEQQLKKQDQVERMQAQLEEQKKKLEDMQEDARKQGFGNSVYEPPSKE